MSSISTRISNTIDTYSQAMIEAKKILPEPEYEKYTKINEKSLEDELNAIVSEVVDNYSISIISIIYNLNKESKDIQRYDIKVTKDNCLDEKICTRYLALIKAKNKVNYLEKSCEAIQDKFKAEIEVVEKSTRIIVNNLIRYNKRMSLKKSLSNIENLANACNELESEVPDIESVIGRLDYECEDGISELNAEKVAEIIKSLK